MVQATTTFSVSILSSVGSQPLQANTMEDKPVVQIKKVTHWNLSYLSLPPITAHLVNSFKMMACAVGPFVLRRTFSIIIDFLLLYGCFWGGAIQSMGWIVDTWKRAGAVNVFLSCSILNSGRMVYQAFVGGAFSRTARMADFHRSAGNAGTFRAPRGKFAFVFWLSFGCFPERCQHFFFGFKFFRRNAVKSFLLSFHFEVFVQNILLTLIIYSISSSVFTLKQHFTHALFVSRAKK